ncbi:SNF2 domain-containing protein CLASSY 2 [Nymphaea thermarum]|nr:SNF2 domain-containing protein CLASSY 2 [Nymphaea thermarum]
MGQVLQKVVGYLVWLATSLLIRPGKTSKLRKYWNWYHHWVGRIAWLDQRLLRRQSGERSQVMERIPWHCSCGLRLRFSCSGSQQHLLEIFSAHRHRIEWDATLQVYRNTRPYHLDPISSSRWKFDIRIQEPFGKKNPCLNQCEDFTGKEWNMNRLSDLDEDLPGKFNLRNITNNSARSEDVWSLILDMRSKLHVHQKKAFEFIWKNIAGSVEIGEMDHTSGRAGGCIVSHSPGTGKTLLNCNNPTHSWARAPGLADPNPPPSSFGSNPKKSMTQV